MQDNVDKRQGWEERKKRKEQQLERWWSKRVKGNSSLQWGGASEEEQETGRSGGTKKARDSEAEKGHVEASKKKDSERARGDEVG